MAANTNQDRATEVLQDLGLKEYEAKSFVALSRLPRATAKDISEVTDVPRTRVYDATRVLEAKGLVEIQHSNPQQFRSVPVEEAIETLQDQYESRVEILRNSLQGMEPVEVDDDTVAQEVWAMSDSEGIANRTQSLIQEASQEIVLVVGKDALLTDELFGSLSALPEEVTVIVGALSETTQQRIQEAIPRAEVFVSGIEWLHSGEENVGETEVGRLLLVDRGTILVSSWEPDTGKERAVFGRGFNNGLVVLARRLMATGLVPGRETA